MKNTAYYEKLLRRLRQRVFSYPPEKDDQVGRIFAKLKDKCKPEWNARYQQSQEDRMKVYYL